MGGGTAGGTVDGAAVADFPEGTLTGELVVIVAGADIGTRTTGPPGTGGRGGKFVGFSLLLLLVLLVFVVLVLPALSTLDTELLLD